MKLERIWFIGCMICAITLFTTSCIQVDDKTQQEISIKLDRLSELSKDMSEAYAKYKTGELTASEFKDLTVAIKTTISETKDEVAQLKEDGVGTGSLVIATLLGLISRGLPSKGPLGLLVDLFARKRKEE